MDYFVRPSIFLLLVLIINFGCARDGIYHSVRPGETLYRIGKTYGVDPQQLARANGIFVPRNLQAGQRLFVPGARRPLRVVPYGQAETAAEPVATTHKPAGTSKSSVKSPVKKKAASKKSLSKASRTVEKKIVSNDKIPKFSWPVQGRVLRSFNPQGKIPCRGLEIGVSLGTVVKSAGAGRVIYSGNGIRGYGNLLILEHEDAFFTVYGYNQKNLVQTGAFVGDGEKIALTGTPPDGRSPRLHFEVRQGNEALDPRLFLP